jgi:4'-phosphopantetheinyl transferase
MTPVSAPTNTAAVVADGAIRQGACLVWWSPLREVTDYSVLDPVERLRRDTYRPGSADRDRFTLGATLLRIAAGHAIGVAPEAVRIDRTCAACGQPHVSLSHSGYWVVVAATRLGPVGIDVEEVGATKYHRLLRHVAAEGEEVEDFVQTWSRKESVMKATGDGLRARMTGIVFDSSGLLLRYPERKGMAARVVDLAPDRHHRAAVTVLTREAVEVEERFVPAL